MLPVLVKEHIKESAMKCPNLFHRLGFIPLLQLCFFWGACLPAIGSLAGQATLEDGDGEQLITVQLLDGPSAGFQQQISGDGRFLFAPVRGGELPDLRLRGGVPRAGERE